MGVSIHSVEITLLVLVVLVALLAVLARRLKVPYPIILVLGGLALSFIPFVPNVRLSPTVVFLVILPPLIFASALTTPWREFQFNIISISMLGLGLVAFTVIGVAVFAHLLIPGFDWRTGAVLGALISPTDIIAVSAIAKRVGLPHSVFQVIEGESLINDAVGLLALQFTTGLIVSGTIPSWSQGLNDFAWLIVGGVAAGLLIAFLVTRFDQFLIGRFSAGTDLQMLVSLATPYFAYLLGEAIHASGVLATVACGLYVGRNLSETFSSRARLDTRVIWNTVDFALNGFVFIIIGLQLPAILSGIRPDGNAPLDWTRLVGEALLVCAVIIGLRYLWIFPGTRIAHFLRTHLQKQNIALTSKRELVVMGWSGMRGVLTLAAALSVPFVTDAGRRFPQREAIIFLAYAVIVITLVGQGLTLPALIRRLGVSEPRAAHEEEREARKTMLQFVVKYLRNLDTSEDEVGAQAVDQLIRVYDQRLQGISSSSEEQIEAQLDRKYREVARRLRVAQRRELNRLRYEGRFREATLRRLERELDLMELRWGD